MLVSVIINFRNAAPFLREAIESALSQTYSDIEVILWDNLSDDGSSEIAQAYGTRVRYFRGSQLVSLGEARNEAILRCEGELIAILDGDDVWEPTKIEQQVAALEKDSGSVVAYTDAWITDASGRATSLYSGRAKPSSGHVFDALFLNNFVCFSSAVIRRSALDAIGPFRTDLEIAEDADILLRLAERGTFVYLDMPLTRYRVHGANWSRKVRLGRLEWASVARDCMRRDPEIRTRLGAIVVRYRLAGLSCTPAEERVLRGHLREARRLLPNGVGFPRLVVRTMLFSVASLFGVGFTSRALAGWIRIRGWRA